MFLILGIIPINVSTSLSIVFASSATFGMVKIIKEIKQLVICTTNAPNLPALPLLDGHLDDQVVLDVLQTHACHARQLNVHLDVCAQVGGGAI